MTSAVPSPPPQATRPGGGEGGGKSEGGGGGFRGGGGRDVGSGGVRGRGESFPGVSRPESWLAGSSPRPPPKVFQLSRNAPRHLASSS